MIPDEWQALRIRCENCTACALRERRNKLVFGKGSQEAEVLLVGEGPGQQEDLTGEPFVGAAGKLLDDMLSIIDLDLSNCYVANVVKCRPPGNRDPLPAEQDACIGFLREQFRLLRPRVVICLGRIAAMRLIDERFRITRDHGSWTYVNGVWYTAIYHPSALLRDVTKRPETFRDLLAIRAKIKEVCVGTYKQGAGA